MLLQGTDGQTFNSRQLQSVLERYDDATLGPIARVQLADSSLRLVRFAELDLAAREDAINASFFASWRAWPSVR